MSEITAPSMPISPFYIGKTLCGNLGCLDIFGYPLPNNLSQDIYGIVGEHDWSISNRTTLFDVSSLAINHEVVVVGYHPSSTHPTANISLEWYRERDNRKLFNFSTDTDLGCGGWLGYCTEESFAEEIAENGDYKVVITATGGVNFAETIYFAVKGIPPSIVLKNPTNNSFDWIGRISNYFDSSNYIRIGIATEQVTNGQSNAPSGILDYVNAGSNNGGCAAESTATGLSTGTVYTIYGFAQAVNGLYYQCGQGTIVTTGESDDHGNSRDTATVINLNRPIAGEIEIPRDKDYFKFTTDVAGIYKIYTTGNLDTTGTLEDSIGIPLISDDDSGEGTNFLIEQSLSADTIYYVQVTAFGDYTGSYTLQVESPNNDRPTEWEWNATELNAFSNNGAVTDLTYLRWNEFVDKVIAFEEYYYGEGGYRTDLTIAKMTDTDKILTATRFNQARYAIGSMYPTGITARNTGDTVFGDYFRTLADSLNNIYKP